MLRRFQLLIKDNLLQPQNPWYSNSCGNKKCRIWARHVLVQVSGSRLMSPTCRVLVEKGTGWPRPVPGDIRNMEGFQAAIYLQWWFYVASFLISKSQNRFCFSTRSFCRCSTGCCWVSCAFLWDVWSQWTRLAQHWDLICCKSTTTIESPGEGGESRPGLSLEFAPFFCSGWDGLAPGELVARHVEYCGINGNVHKDLHRFCIFCSWGAILFIESLSFLPILVLNGAENI